uniref:Phosphatidylethanolamine N-methyltransferase n=1 Tax=Sus scrofa TaxID=9823 RepID=A0A8D1GKR1_PIG
MEAANGAQPEGAWHRGGGEAGPGRGALEPIPCTQERRSVPSDGCCFLQTRQVLGFCGFLPGLLDVWDVAGGHTPSVLKFRRRAALGTARLPDPAPVADPRVLSFQGTRARRDSFAHECEFSGRCGGGDAGGGTLTSTQGQSGRGLEAMAAPCWLFEAELSSVPQMSALGSPLGPLNMPAGSCNPGPGRGGVPARQCAGHSPAVTGLLAVLPPWAWPPSDGNDTAGWVSTLILAFVRLHRSHLRWTWLCPSRPACSRRADLCVMTRLLGYVDPSDARFVAAVLTIAFNPLFWNVVARWEHKTRKLSRAFGSPRLACYTLGGAILLLNLLRSHCFTQAMLSQPQMESLGGPTGYRLGLALLGVGSVFVLSSFLALGFTGTFLGDYFGILMEARVTRFPFSVLDNPMYWGSTAVYLGWALMHASPTGLLLTLVVAAIYKLAILFEEPFTAEIYRQRGSQARKRS